MVNLTNKPKQKIIGNTLERHIGTGGGTLSINPIENISIISVEKFDRNTPKIPLVTEDSLCGWSAI